MGFFSKHQNYGRSDLFSFKSFMGQNFGFINFGFSSQELVHLLASKKSTVEVLVESGVPDCGLRG